MRILKKVGQFLRQVLIDFNHDNAAEWSAAIAYYALLSTFPLLISAVAISGMVADPQWSLQQVNRFVNELFPAGQGALLTITQEVLTQRGSLSILSLVVLVWSGMRVFGTIMKALNIAFNTGEDFTFLRRTLVEFLMMLTLGGIYLLTIAVDVFFTYLVNSRQVEASQASGLIGVGTELVTALLFFVAFYMTYKLVPRCDVRRRTAAVGALLATILFVFARPLFGNYVARFANYTSTYGSIALIITFVVWVWFVSLIFIFSGEVASHYQALLLEARAPEEVEKRHLRRDPTRKDVEHANLPPKEEEISGTK